MEEILEKIKAGDRTALSRAITLLEKDRDFRKEIIKRIHKCCGKARIVCFTGPPGVGKSTLIDQIIGILLSRGKKVGVILVDPRSPYTGGSLLGDRIRMQRHATNPNVFIRSLSTLGDPSGLSRIVKDVIKLMDAFGMDYIIVETVGTGQIAVDVSHICHTTILVLMPNMGDDIQMMKAGIMEVADIFVINKADLPGADLTEGYLKSTVNENNVPVVKTVAYNRATVVPLVDLIEKYVEIPMPRKISKMKGLLKSMVLDYIEEKTLEYLERSKDIENYAEKVANEEIDYYTALEKIYEKLTKEVLCK